MGQSPTVWQRWARQVSARDRPRPGRGGGTGFPSRLLEQVEEAHAHFADAVLMGGLEGEGTDPVGEETRFPGNFYRK